MLTPVCVSVCERIIASEGVKDCVCEPSCVTLYDTNVALLYHNDIRFASSFHLVPSVLEQSLTTLFVSWHVDNQLFILYLIN